MKVGLRSLLVSIHINKVFWRTFLGYFVAMAWRLNQVVTRGGIDIGNVTGKLVAGSALAGWVQTTSYAQIS